MSAAPAARLYDPIEHTNALTGLLVGAAIGVAFGVFVVATGGAGAVVGAAIIGGAMATGAGIGEVVGSLSFMGGTITGGIATGSPDTTTNSLLATRATDDSVHCRGTPPIYLPSHEGKRVAQGSGTVFINLLPASRVGDKIECGAKIKEGSPNVIIGGETVQTLDIDSEVPDIYHKVIMVVGLASAVILAGPVVAILGTLGSMGGGALAQWGAAKLGLSEDWQKIAGLGGSLLGGFLGGKGGGMLGRTKPVARLEQAAMRPLLQRAPRYRSDLASMKGSSPTQTEARSQVARSQRAGTQAAEAASWQGKGNYPGQDPMRNTQMQTGERYVAGVNQKGEPSGYFVSERAYNEHIANGGTRESFWQGVQVAPGGPKYGNANNPLGYREQLGVFEINRPIDAAVGPTVANPQYGRGGLEQYFTSNWNGNVTRVGTVTPPGGGPTLSPYAGPGVTFGTAQGGSVAPTVVDGASKAPKPPGGGP